MSPNNFYLTFILKSLQLHIIFVISQFFSASGENILTTPSVADFYPLNGQQQSSEESTDLHQTDDSEPTMQLTRIPYASSPLYLNYLAQTEQLVYNALANYEKQLLTRLDILRSYREDYEESVLRALEQTGKANEYDQWQRAAKVSTNPFLVYRMIRRFARDIPAFTDHLWQSLENEIYENLESWKGGFAWPSEQDFAAATKSLIRLQNVHDFDINYFADGELKDDKSLVKVGLTAQQCLEVSRFALDLVDVTAATDWFQAAHSKVVHSSEKSISMDELTEAWEATYNAFQDVWPIQNFKTHDVFNEAKAVLRQEFEASKLNRTFDNRITNFKALCRGDGLKTPFELSKLTCFLDKTRNPYWVLHPLQIEVFNWKPLIYQVHNFIPPRALEKITEFVVTSMVSVAESGAAYYQVTDENHDDSSTFTHSWVNDLSTPDMYSLSRKIEMATGLHVLKNGASEPYQMASYAVGNHYIPCLDCFEREKELGLQEAGRKITTVHAILHEPEQGGELAFTLTGSLVKPVLGSIIVYNNVRRDGEINEKILHGSCPVLSGQKWVATKWIYEFENFDKRPCLRKS